MHTIDILLPYQLAAAAWSMKKIHFVALSYECRTMQLMKHNTDFTNSTQTLGTAELMVK